MPITFTNNWKNILDKLENILKSEFKGAMPVFRGEDSTSGTQFLIIEPIGTSLIEYNVTSETREFDVEISFHFRDANMKKNSLDHVFRQVSRIEALIHDNVTMTLADSTIALNCELSSCDLDVGDSESEYVVSWDFSCIHQGNFA